MKIGCVIAAYNPDEKDFNKFETYINEVDFCVIADDSENDNETKLCEFLKKYNGKVVYRWNKKNLGLCKSVNQQFKYFYDNGYDWVLVMNPDGYFEDGAVNKMIELADQIDYNSVGIIAPTYNFDRHKRKAKFGYKKIKMCDMSGSLYNVKILNELNYYDEKTYFYGLDSEYCVRLNKKKIRIIECSPAVLNHKPATTCELKIGKKVIFKYGKDSPLRYYYQFRSGKYIHKKHHNFYLDMFMFYKYLKILFLFDRKKEYFKMLKRAKIDFKRGYFGKIEA